ncbi:MAG: TVP38/TMEM64 family protein, partial [Gammaproteobacteria bacterium]|nr:TVP38/TMEM64 family protein [Gammaproteobacteria bacterium]
MKNLSKIILLLVIAVGVSAYFAYDLGQYLTLDYIKQQRSDLSTFYNDNAMLTVLSYVLVYVVVTALSLPGAAIMTVLGGAIMGLGIGTVAVSFASTIGATLAFLVSRFMLRDYVQSHFKEKLRAINEGVNKDGSLYLFTLRLIPIFPFFVINLVMGLTPIKTWKFYLVSQLGMLPGTFVYVNAGSQL